MRHTNRIRLVGALAALAVATVASLAGTAGGSAGSTADQFRAAERALIRATVAADTAAAGKLLASDFQLINPLGAPESREAYLETIGGGLDFVTFEPTSRIRVRVHGDTATARYQADFEIVAGPERLEHKAWITDLFERRRGRWQLVWSQTTATPNDPALLIEALRPVEQGS